MAFLVVVDGAMTDCVNLLIYFADRFGKSFCACIVAVVTDSKPRRSPKPQERRRDADRTRRSILDAAVVEFAAHGYAGARIAAISARAGVNQQLISYYFGGKEGLYQAMSERLGRRQSELMPPGVPLSEQLHRYVLEALSSRDDMRLLVWSGLEYDGPQSDPGHTSWMRRLDGTVEHVTQLRESGKLPDWVDSGCLTVMVMAAAMAPVTLPRIIEGLLEIDPESPEFVERYADQLAKLVEYLNLQKSDRSPNT
ncbi:TetR family transcriptional regulator [Amycolatopsis coloradensis]|uniref:TetR family transcriptional regulator n=1 Tax=Amycolatopsis coloradensis TaxID=76021 RepID=A0ACD5BJD9_9PSEU